MENASNRPGRRRRAWIALPLIVAAVAACAPAAAQGGTGGAGVATGPTGSGIAFSPLRSAGATWYGPGLYGSRTACGQVLRPQTIGVAHRELPCGTPVKFVYHGRAIVTTVIDRGPYARGKDWDLTNGARRALHFNGSGQIRYAVALKYARAE